MRAARPNVTQLRPALSDLAATAPDLLRSFEILNALVNALAYNPPGDARRGLPVLGVLAQPPRADAVREPGRARAAPRAASSLISCQSLALLDNVIAQNPQLGVLTQLLDAPPRRRSARPRHNPRRPADAEVGPVLRPHRRDGGLRAVLLRAGAVPVAGVRRPRPAQAEGLPRHRVVRRGLPARDGGRRAHLRRARRQGQGDRARRETGRSLVTIELDAKYAPLPSDAEALLRQKTLLGETYVELTPGTRRRAAAARGRAARRRPDRRRRSSSTRSCATFDPRTRAAFREWMQTQAVAITGARPRPQRGARQPRAVRGGRGGPGRHPQPSGAGRAAPGRQHRASSSGRSTSATASCAS